MEESAREYLKLAKNRSAVARIGQCVCVCVCSRSPRGTMTVRPTHRSTSLRSRRARQGVVLRFWIWPKGCPKVTRHRVVRNLPCGNLLSRTELTTWEKRIQELKIGPRRLRTGDSDLLNHDTRSRDFMRAVLVHILHRRDNVGLPNGQWERVCVSRQL